jgi:beta-mannosidase
VNDLVRPLPGCTVGWLATDEAGAIVAQGQQGLDLAADARVRVADLSWEVRSDVTYCVALTLRDAAGQLLAHNVYRDPFHHPPHPAGHPQRMSHELGMRLYSA